MKGSFRFSRFVFKFCRLQFLAFFAFDGSEGILVLLLFCYSGAIFVWLRFQLSRFAAFLVRFPE